MSQPSVTSAQILGLLAERHTGDVFVPECKDGPSQYGSHRRLDAWAMNRSWANARVSAYEIKVSRSDFLGDEKWRDYLDLCNCLSFVCPRGVIAPEELPADVGLIWISKTGTRLYTKRKAVHREVEIPEGVWRYVLMCRSKITAAGFNERGASDTTVYWQAWLKRKSETQQLGYEVGQRVREITERLETENKRLAEQITSYDRFRAKLAEIGIDPDKPVDKWTQQRAIERLFGEHAPGVVKKARDLEWKIQGFRKALESELRPTPTPEPKP